VVGCKGILRFQQIVAAARGSLFLPVWKALPRMSNSTSSSPAICAEGGSGLILPLVPNEHEWGDAARGVIYFIFLIWLFEGVGIGSDIFMGAIEKVTSAKRRKFNKATGRYITVMVWNPTVSNLSLMALGSSAPEILLSVIELLGNNVMAGDLGPSTIVGSAAFNLFVILAVCVMAIPAPEVRKIKETRVYCITATFSVFAYLWLLLILMGSSPNVVEVWEAVLTFLFFPLLLTLAWMADKGYFGGDDGPKMGHGVVLTAHMSPEEMKEMEDDIVSRHGNGQALSREALAQIIEIESSQPKGLAQYRRGKKSGKANGPSLQKVDPAGGPIKPPSTNPAKIVPIDGDEDDTHIQPAVEYVYFNFDITKRAVMEDVGQVECVVIREGGEEFAASVAYRTKDGTAKAPSDYTEVEGRLNFAAGETQKSFFVTIIDDEGEEEREEFYCVLSAPEVQGAGSSWKGKIGEDPEMTIMIIDNDVPGTLMFPEDDIHVKDTPGEDQKFEILVDRRHGATGKVSCKYRSEGGTAQEGDDFEPLEGVVEFESGECTKKIIGTIKGKQRYEAQQLFRVFLEEPEGGAKFDPLTDGGEEQCILTVLIDAEMVARDPIEKLRSSVAMRWDKAKVGNANYQSQFIDALFQVFEDEEEEDGEARSMGDTISGYVWHIIDLPFKLLFALVPPTDYLGGWLCFCASLSLIGFVTAIIGDVAALFGCSIGLPDNITAITFVALGTSLPDTFASKAAAQSEPYADASVGNVTGSNSVNVFLGLGMPWTIGAIYWVMGTTPAWRDLFENDPEVPVEWRSGAFIVKAGDLGFSVSVFSGCACVCIGVLAVRRMMFGGELGGPKGPQVASAAFMVFLWFLYVALSCWKSLAA